MVDNYYERTEDYFNTHLCSRCKHGIFNKQIPCINCNARFSDPDTGDEIKMGRLVNLRDIPSDVCYYKFFYPHVVVDFQPLQLELF